MNIGNYIWEKGLFNKLPYKLFLWMDQNVSACHNVSFIKQMPLRFWLIKCRKIYFIHSDNVLFHTYEFAYIFF